MKGGMVPTRKPGNLAVFLNSVMTVLYLSAAILASTCIKPMFESVWCWYLSWDGPSVCVNHS